MVASENELGDVARLARESVVVANAVTLARWIGTCRRPVTAALVLRKADIPAACAAESFPQEEDSVRLLVLALLKVLGEDRVPRVDRLWDPVYAALRDLCDRYDKSVWGPLHAADRYYDLDTETPLAGLVALLAEFGAVTGDPGKPVITPLGRWAAGRLPEGLPGLADPGLPAAEMIAEAARFG